MSAQIEPRPADAVLTGSLLPALHAELIALLRALPAESWLRRTSAGPWRVRDVVAHLLDGDLRRLALLRDGHTLLPGTTIEGYSDLLGYLNELNATWVRATERLSPRLLVELLDSAGRQSAELLAALDPFGPAVFPVAWAGEASSLNWMDVGREYTERWHHQDQIREAVGATPLLARRWLAPVLAISVRALPRAYARVAADAGTHVTLVVEGEAAGAWTLTRTESGWSLGEGEAAAAACRIIINDVAAGRLLMHRLRATEAEASVHFEGDARLGRPFLTARAVMV